MMELSFRGIPEGFSEILISQLFTQGFEGFREAGEVLFAYIPENRFREGSIRGLVRRHPELKYLTWTTVSLPEQNWNALWENSFEPVLVAGKCFIRAPFHPAPNLPGKKPFFDIIIEPKMSFGTGHHETTSLMIEWLLEEEIRRKSVLDLGCGSGILAILSRKLGAEHVIAADNDPRACENTRENILKNNAGDIHVIQGELRDIPGNPVDLILANIGRNTLLELSPAFAGYLKSGGSALLSGFYATDLQAIKEEAERNGFSLLGTRSRNGWIAIKLGR
jgi:ribosomal protein L11 methyltransferase